MAHTKQVFSVGAGFASVFSSSQVVPLQGFTKSFSEKLGKGPTAFLAFWRTSGRGTTAMPVQKPDTDELLRRIDAGDASAAGELLDRHRVRLRQMVAARIDPRLAARVDPSDVVQDALAEASRKLPQYLLDRPVSFYPWLRQIAWERLMHLHAQHVRAQKRSVTREGRPDLALPDESAMQLVDRLVAGGTSPSRRAAREEMRQRVRAALESLPSHYREAVILRHLEQLSFEEIAGVLGISQTATRSRYRRAVERLHNRLSENLCGEIR